MQELLKKEAFWEALVLFNNASDPELKFQAIYAAFDCLEALEPEAQYDAAMQIYFGAGASEIEKMALEQAFKAIEFLKQKDQFAATKKVFDKATDPDLKKRASERLKLFTTARQLKAFEQVNAAGSLGPHLEVVPFN